MVLLEISMSSESQSHLCAFTKVIFLVWTERPHSWSRRPLFGANCCQCLLLLWSAPTRWVHAVQKRTPLRCTNTSLPQLSLMMPSLLARRALGITLRDMMFWECTYKTFWSLSLIRSSQWALRATPAPAVAALHNRYRGTITQTSLTCSLTHWLKTLERVAIVLSYKLLDCHEECFIYCVLAGKVWESSYTNSFRYNLPAMNHKSDRMWCFWWKFFPRHWALPPGHPKTLLRCCQRTAGSLVFWSPWPPCHSPGCWLVTVTQGSLHLLWNHPPIRCLIGKSYKPENSFMHTIQYIQHTSQQHVAL